VATLNLATVLDAVEQLTRSITTALGHADVMLAHERLNVNVLRGMRQSLEGAYSTLSALREGVLTGSAGAADALRETALRERGAAVVSQVAELRIAETEAATYGRDLLGGRFRTLLDVTLYILNGVTQANSKRLDARLAAEAAIGDDVFTIAAQREAYQFALEDAEQDFAAVGQDPDFVRFLEVGAWVPSEPFRTACRVIAMLFDVPITTRRAHRITNSRV
jgi:hypothetical protein